jgi:hypothetical protein
MMEISEEVIEMAKKIDEEMQKKGGAKTTRCRKLHVNPDGTFKGGFKGCVKYVKCIGGYKDPDAVCAKIGRAAGKISKEEEPEKLWEKITVEEVKKLAEEVEKREKTPEELVEEQKAEIERLEKIIKELEECKGEEALAEHTKELQETIDKLQKQVSDYKSSVVKEIVEMDKDAKEEDFEDWEVEKLVVLRDKMKAVAPKTTSGRTTYAEMSNEKKTAKTEKGIPVRIE